MSVLAPTRRGACPTLTAPMRTGDGLLARIRVENGRLTPAQLADLARLAAVHGNGLIEVTARGNLQVRGLSESSAPPFAAAVGQLLTVEDGLVVDHSPITGEDPTELAGSRPLVEAIRTGAQKFLGQLGPKVSVVVDSGGQVPLAALKADVRLVAVDAHRWSVSLGGGKAQLMDADGAVAATLAFLGALAAIGPDARAVDLFPVRSASRASNAKLAIDALSLHIGHTTPIALPFGAADAKMLIDLANAAIEAGVTTLRLAPGHSLLIDNAPSPLLKHADSLGFITRADDPRLHISACIGSRGCAAGHIPARELAARLASLVPTKGHLHVSGCDKGCAHPRAAELTLVGRADGIGLVIDGRPGDTHERIMNEAELPAVLAARQEGR